jgi:Na+-driven multidrug efflux pump
LLCLRPRQFPFRFQLLVCFGYTAIFWVLMMLVPGVVAGIFTSDAALIQYTTWAMRIYMAGIFSLGIQIACQQSFMALGQAKVSLLLACLRKLILLIPLIFILPHVVADPVFGVFLAEPVSDIIAAAVTAATMSSTTCVKRPASSHSAITRISGSVPDLRIRMRPLPWQ